MNFITLPDYFEIGDKFWDSYTPIAYVFLPITSNKKNLKKRKVRKCKYCNLSYPETTFKNDAHFLPHSLGNTTLFSDFECDNCNSLFGKYEDQVAKMFDIERPLNLIKGKKNYPGFLSPDKKSKIKVTDFQDGKAVEISRVTTENDIMTFDQESLTWKIKLKRNVFIPNLAYKFFIKLGLSLLPEKVINEKYKLALNYILNKSEIKIPNCIVTGYVLPIGIKSEPHAYLFEKKNKNEKIISHVLSFYYLNYIYSIPIVLHKDDITFYNRSIEVFTYPPFFLEGSDIEKIKVDPFYFNFASEKNEKYEDMEVYIKIEKDEWENRAAYDINNNQLINGKEFSSNEIIKFLLFEGDSGNISFPIKLTE